MWIEKRRNEGQTNDKNVPRPSFNGIASTFDLYTAHLRALFTQVLSISKHIHRKVSPFIAFNYASTCDGGCLVHPAYVSCISCARSQKSRVHVSEI